MTVRLVQEDQMVDYMRCMRTAFFGDREPTEENAAWLARHAEMDRTWSAFDDDGTLCGTTRSFTTDLTVPGGGFVPMAAVTQVTVLPTHRRRGHLSGMMGALIADARARDELAAGLIASEWPIYGRFGYGPATEWATTSVDSRLAQFLAEPTGSIEFVDRRELRKLAPEPFDRNRRATPGSVSRDDGWWDVLTGVDPRPGDTPSNKEARAVHRDDHGEVDGYVVYAPVERWENGVSRSRVEVSELLAATSAAYDALWHFLCDIDLAVEIHAWPRPIDESLALHLVDGRALRWRERNDQLWVLLLDVRRALEARTYRGEGSLVLDVDGTRYHLDGGPQGATCALTTDDADLEMPIASLGAAYLGGTRFHALAGAGRVHERRDGALATADAMFGIDTAPYLTTHF
jgi:predicted acetyltransferase